jgi:hypothetical protein
MVPTIKRFFRNIWIEFYLLCVKEPSAQENHGRGLLLRRSG